MIKEGFLSGNNETATIDFLPLCSFCGFRIYDRVDIFNDVISERLYKSNDKYQFLNTIISPSYCKNCGRRFTAIRIPSKLPFEGML